MHYTLNASYISNSFHFSPSASSQWLSVALEQHELSPHPASWHFWLSHFCPGCSTGSLESQAFANRSWPLTKKRLKDDTGRKTEIKADTAPVGCLKRCACAPCLFVFLFNTLMLASCSHWNPQLSNCVSTQTKSCYAERGAGERRESMQQTWYYQCLILPKITTRKLFAKF